MGIFISLPAGNWFRAISRFHLYLQLGVIDPVSTWNPETTMEVRNLETEENGIGHLIIELTLKIIDIILYV